MEHKELEKILKALANRRRLAIVRALKDAREAHVGDVAWEIHLSFAATSRHLVIMERAGILEKTQRDKKVFYRLAQPAKFCIANVIGEA
jgi:ArsR family transcriptional regulator